MEVTVCLRAMLQVRGNWRQTDKRMQSLLEVARRRGAGNKPVFKLITRTESQPLSAALQRCPGLTTANAVN